ncbi:DUF5672 family protein [Mucilaginibacter psychrotolerans]|uniref:DUF5672 domain-containing protein n=1 Tax=Mucilaginibacter psychrotolerans TaxID=1524096 RepID=A0A4Y8S443_9SPHI|nr:DUF5672 family protein [Mucilaginibacter psychrotolerans]TFF33703.1 hypothetical protein E2R66_24845 [Mucilaginibacter psychrotolerans]
MTQGTQKVAVVIPFYRDTISAFEQIALEQCYNVLAAYPIVAIKPKSLLLPAALQGFNFTNTINFEDKYFDGIKGYNTLMLSADFYETFLGYEYILVYQLDAFVFKDELADWCSRNYDYIGAPWLKRKTYGPLKDKFYAFKYYLHTRFDLKKDGIPTTEQFYNRVGNGGFSLRRVKKFHDLSVLLRDEALHYLRQNNHRFNEDAFWSIAVNRRQKSLHIPHYKVAAGFSVEFEPDRAWQINKGNLPFGCHAWDLYLDYWRPVFKQYGYDI